VEEEEMVDLEEEVVDLEEDKEDLEEDKEDPEVDKEDMDKEVVLKTRNFRVRLWIYEIKYKLNIE